jgi:hypothetical protein
MAHLCNGASDAKSLQITRPAAAPAPVVDAGAQEGSSATSVAREGISVISEGPEKLIECDSFVIFVLWG